MAAHEEAWNVKIRGWKCRVTRGLSAVESRGVGGHGDKGGRDGGGGEELERQRRWGRKVWGSQRRGWKKQRIRGEEKGSWPTTPSGLPFVTWQPPFLEACPLGAQPSTPSMQGEVLSPLSALFSFQEGSGSRCRGWDIPWLCSPFPDFS